jgi:hypothetical protein
VVVVVDLEITVEERGGDMPHAMLPDLGVTRFF